MILWANHSRARFFLISDANGLPSGYFVIHTLTGRKQWVDEMALVPFEVTEEQAKEWVKGEFGKILDSVRGAVNRFVENLRTGPGKPDRIADPRELLDRVEAIIELIVAQDLVGSATAKDVEALADRFGYVEARLRKLARTLSAAPSAASPTS